MTLKTETDPVMGLLMTIYSGETHILRASEQITKRLVSMSPGERKLIRNKVRSVIKLLEAMDKALEE